MDTKQFVKYARVDQAPDNSNSLLEAVVIIHYSHPKRYRDALSIVRGLVIARKAPHPRVSTNTRKWPLRTCSSSFHLLEAPTYNHFEHPIIFFFLTTTFSLLYLSVVRYMLLLVQFIFDTFEAQQRRLVSFVDAT